MSKLPDMSVLPEYVFEVRTCTDGVLDKYDVEAAYFQETGQYTQFKDALHTVVDAVVTRSVLRIKRVEGPLDDA